MNQLETYCTELKEKNCTLCSLNTNNSKIVVNRGSYLADIMVIGMGPGEQEQKQGLPFVGPSGQFANEMFESIGIDPHKDIFWTNIVLHRTMVNGQFKDRDPRPEEYDVCKTHLNNMINLLKPRFIITFGKPTYQALTDTVIQNWVKEYCGKVKKYLLEGKTYKVMPLMHPAYILRNPSMMDLAKEHAQIFYNFYTENLK